LRRTGGNRGLEDILGPVDTGTGLSALGFVLVTSVTAAGAAGVTGLLTHFTIVLFDVHERFGDVATTYDEADNQADC
jgi:hypothetical protein